MDKNIKQKIDELGVLSDRIKKLEEELKKLKKQEAPLDKDLTEYLKEVSNTKNYIITTESYIVKLETPFNVNTGTSKKYKEAFELALTKVNEATKKVLNDALAATAGDTTTKLKYSINSTKPTNESFSGIWNKTKNVFKGLLNKITGYNNQIKKANSVLSKLANKVTNESVIIKEEQEVVEKFVNNIVRKDLEVSFKRFKNILDNVEADLPAGSIHKLFINTVKKVVVTIK